MDEDRPLTHARNLNEFLDQYGVVRADRSEALELRKHIQGEIIVDDARHLVRPLTVPVAYYHAYQGATVGLFSVVRFSFRSSGGGYVIGP